MEEIGAWTAEIIGDVGLGGKAIYRSKKSTKVKLGGGGGVVDLVGTGLWKVEGAVGGAVLCIGGGLNVELADVLEGCCCC